MWGLFHTYVQFRADLQKHKILGIGMLLQIVYDRNQVMVSGTITKVQFQYWYQS